MMGRIDFSENGLITVAITLGLATIFVFAIGQVLAMAALASVIGIPIDMLTAAIPTVFLASAFAQAVHLALERLERRSLLISAALGAAMLVAAPLCSTASPNGNWRRAWRPTTPSRILPRPASRLRLSRAPTAILTNDRTVLTSALEGAQPSGLGAEPGDSRRRLPDAEQAFHGAGRCCSQLYRRRGRAAGPKQHDVFGRQRVSGAAGVLSPDWKQVH